MRLLCAVVLAGARRPGIPQNPTTSKQVSREGMARLVGGLVLRAVGDRVAP